MLKADKILKKQLTIIVVSAIVSSIIIGCSMKSDSDVPAEAWSEEMPLDEEFASWTPLNEEYEDDNLKCNPKQITENMINVIRARDSYITEPETLCIIREATDDREIEGIWSTTMLVQMPHHSMDYFSLNMEIENQINKEASFSTNIFSSCFSYDYVIYTAYFLDKSPDENDYLLLNFKGEADGCQSSIHEMKVGDIKEIPDEFSEFLLEDNGQSYYLSRSGLGRIDKNGSLQYLIAVDLIPFSLTEDVPDKIVEKLDIYIPEKYSDVYTIDHKEYKCLGSFGTLADTYYEAYLYITAPLEYLSEIEIFAKDVRLMFDGRVIKSNGIEFYSNTAVLDK